MPETTDRHEFGRRFREAREALGLTQQQAAEILGIPSPRISEIEHGRRVPSFPRAMALIQMLDLDLKIMMPEFFPPEKKRK